MSINEKKQIFDNAKNNLKKKLTNPLSLNSQKICEFYFKFCL